MPNDWFQFKQFIVKQDRCAMKVGTDGILLGSWCNVDGCKNIIDIGTGTGLIALMCAQRSQADITAIEIDESSAEQAEENFRASDWAKRLVIIKDDFRKTKALRGKKFDHIVCNPPFFKNSLLGSNNERNIVRHDLKLGFSELLSGSKNLLNKRGRISLIIPALRFAEAADIASAMGLFLIRKTVVSSGQTELALRILAEWSDTEMIKEVHSLYIYQDKSRDYHSDFTALTREFYLDME